MNFSFQGKLIFPPTCLLQDSSISLFNPRFFVNNSKLQMFEFPTIMICFILSTFLSQRPITMFLLNIFLNGIMIFLLTYLAASFSMIFSTLTLQQMRLLLNVKFPFILIKFSYVVINKPQN